MHVSYCGTTPRRKRFQQLSDKTPFPPSPFSRYPLAVRAENRVCQEPLQIAKYYGSAFQDKSCATRNAHRPRSQTIIELWDQHSILATGEKSLNDVLPRYLYALPNRRCPAVRRLA